VFLNTASASFPFVERLAGPGRIVVSATDSTAQRFDTIFPEFFIRALESEAADIDKNDRISIWEAFVAATASVRRHYQQKGQLATERALIDDNGDGIGHEGTAAADDGRVASGVYLDEATPGAPATDTELVRLLQRRAALEMEVDELKVRRQFLAPAEYQTELERIMVALARVQREIRARRGSD
jgi:chorismate mutase